MKRAPAPVIALFAADGALAGSLPLFVTGFAVFFGGAIGIESLSNFVRPGSAGSVLEVLVEETSEMAGETILFWAAWDLLGRSRASIRFDSRAP